MENFYENVDKDRREEGGFYPDKIKFILETIGSKKKVLDIGCNNGFIGEKILKKNNIVFGVDIASLSLEEAKNRGLKVKRIDIEKDDLPYKNESFDIVILGDIIEHVFNTDQLLRESYRVLKKRGVLILSTPNVASLGRRMLMMFGKNPFLEFSSELPTNGLTGVGHIRYYTFSDLVTQLKYNKFTHIHIQGSGYYMPLAPFKFWFLSKIIPSFCTMLLCRARK